MAVLLLAALRSPMMPSKFDSAPPFSMSKTSPKVLLPTTYPPKPTQLLAVPLMVMVWKLAVNWARAVDAPSAKATISGTMDHDLILMYDPLLWRRREFGPVRRHGNVVVSQ